MTNQVSDTLIYNGQSYSIDGGVLGVCFRLGRKEPPFVVQMTCCWRGHRAIYAVENGRLSLMSIDRGYIAKGEQVKIAGEMFRYSGYDFNNEAQFSKATLASVFPESSPLRAFAHWYSGDIIASPQAGGGDILLHFWRGLLIPEGVATGAEDDQQERDSVLGKGYSLIRQMTTDEIELQEQVAAQDNDAPSLPFGFLNAVWVDFKNKVMPGDEVWMFRYKPLHQPFAGNLLEHWSGGAEGYAILREGKVAEKMACHSGYDYKKKFFAH